MSLALNATGDDENSVLCDNCTHMVVVWYTGKDAKTGDLRGHTCGRVRGSLALPAPSSTNGALGRTVPVWGRTARLPPLLYLFCVREETLPGQHA